MPTLKIVLPFIEYENNTKTSSIPNEKRHLYIYIYIYILTLALTEMFAFRTQFEKSVLISSSLGKFLCFFEEQTQQECSFCSLGIFVNL
jgi:hypothetical protein